MSPSINDPARENRSLSKPRIFLLVLLIAIGWLCLEAAIIALWHRGLLPTELLARFLRALPWQVALFSIIGLLISAVSVYRPLTASSVGWLTMGASSFTFLSIRNA